MSAMTTRLSHLLTKTRHITRIHPDLTNSNSILPQRRHTNSTAIAKDYFPWHHSPHALERIVNSDDLSGMPNNFRARFVRKMIAGRELNLNFWDMLPLGFERGWEEELARNFATGE
jgi:hypothetical protein